MTRVPPVQHDAYDLALALYREVPRFPKAQRFVLGQRIEHASLTVLFAVQRARETSLREGSLREASRALDELRLLLRLALDLGFVPAERHGALAERVDALGKQIGGWLKSLSPPRSTP